MVQSDQKLRLPYSKKKKKMFSKLFGRSVAKITCLKNVYIFGVTFVSAACEIIKMSLNLGAPEIVIGCWTDREY